MDIFELAAKLTLDASGFEAGISGAKSLASGIGDVLSGPMGMIADIGSFAKDNIGDAIEVTKGFDAAMSQVAATMGYTVAELNTEGTEAANTFETLSSFAQKMGASTAFSASEAASALNYMALAGYDAATSMDMLPTVLDLAAAGGIGLAQASDMVTDAQSALGLDLDQTRDMVDQMAKASSKSNTSVQQLGEAFLTVGGNAKNLQGGTQELAQVLGLLADNGIKGAEGGTHLRNIMLSLNPTTDAAVAAFEQLGINAYDANGNMRAMADVFGELQTALAGYNQQEQTDLLSAMFNKTDLAAVNALISTTGERWQELGGYIADANGAAAAMAEVQLDNLAGAETLLASAKEGLQIAIGSYFTDIKQTLFTELSNSISIVTDAINSGGIAAGFDALMGIIGEKFTQIVSELPGIISQALPLITEAFSSIGQGVINALPVILEAVQNLMPVVIETIKSAVPQLVENIATMAKMAFEALKGGVTEYSGKIWEAIQDLASKLYEIMPDSMKKVFDDIGAFVKAAGEGISGLVKSIWEAIQAWWDCMKTLFEAVWPTLEPILTALAEGFIEYFKQLWENIKLVFLTLVDVFTDVFEIIKGVCTAAAGIIKGDFTQAEKGIEEAWNGLISFFHDIWEGVKAIFENAVGFFQNIGKLMWEGLKSGITNAIDGVKDWGKNVVESVKGAFDIHSPSRVFEAIGRFMSQGLINGMNANIDTMVDDYANNITERVKGIYGDVRYSDSAIGRSTADTISSMLMGASGKNQDTEINLNVDGKTLATVVYNPLENLVQQKGKGLAYNTAVR